MKTKKKTPTFFGPQKLLSPQRRRMGLSNFLNVFRARVLVSPSGPLPIPALPVLEEFPGRKLATRNSPRAEMCGIKNFWNSNIM